MSTGLHDFLPDPGPDPGPGPGPNPDPDPVCASAVDGNATIKARAMARATINIMNRFRVGEAFVLGVEVSQFWREDGEAVAVIAANPGSFRSPSNTLQKWRGTNYNQVEAIGKPAACVTADKVVHLLRCYLRHYEPAKRS